MNGDGGAVDLTGNMECVSATRAESNGRKVGPFLIQGREINHQSWRTLGGHLGPRKDAPRCLQPGRGRQAARPAGPAGAGQEVTAARDPAVGAEPAGPAWWTPTKL